MNNLILIKKTKKHHHLSCKPHMWHSDTPKIKTKQLWWHLVLYSRSSINTVQQFEPCQWFSSEVLCVSIYLPELQSIQSYPLRFLQESSVAISFLKPCTVRWTAVSSQRQQPFDELKQKVLKCYRENEFGCIGLCRWTDKKIADGTRK